MREEQSSPAGLASLTTRSLACAAGLVSMIALVFYVTYLAPVLVSALILGAVIQPRFLRLGWWLMSSGLLLVAIFILPLGITFFIFLREGQAMQGYPPSSEIIFMSSVVVSNLLVIACAIALVAEAVRAKRSRSGSRG